ncbi:MAG: hypothetical protein Q3996_00600 [Candidatus Saccharibacteria bacterium]|nr:hypothetical protein [Candidatus Saccharibacteria bacterium]
MTGGNTDGLVFLVSIWFFFSSLYSWATMAVILTVWRIRKRLEKDYEGSNLGDQINVFERKVNKTVWLLYVVVAVTAGIGHVTVSICLFTFAAIIRIAELIYIKKVILK